MFKSRWIVAIAFGLIACLGAAQEQPTPKDQPRQSESANNADDGGQENQSETIELTSALDRIETAIRDLIAEEDKTEQERAREQASRDLNAQEGMAWWAELMFYATAGTVVLTFVALVAIIRTLHHTRRAADYTRDMLAQAELTTEAAIAAVGTERAWLTMAQIATQGPTNIEDVSTGKTFNNAIRIMLTWENTGRSPAIKVATRAFVEVRRGADSQVIASFDDVQFSEQDHQGAVGVGQRAYGGTPIIQEDDARDWLEMNATIHLYAIISYNDTFSQTRRVSEICGILTPVIQNLKDGRTIIENSFESRGPRNSIE